MSRRSRRIIKDKEIIGQIMGGLGNQLFIIFTTIAYSLKHNINYSILNIERVRKTYFDKDIYKNIKNVIDNNVEGDIVELGCNIGTTSIFIKKFLNLYAPDRKFHVYDSWKGLPERHEKDGNNTKTFIKGSCQTNKENFINVFKHFNLELPIINDGFFKDIPDEKYPDKIAFAFFDGDLYTSIIDSFNKTFHKISKNGIIIVDDVGGIPLDKHELPGAEIAIKDFFRR